MEDENVDPRVHVQVHDMDQFWSGKQLLDEIWNGTDGSELDAILIVPATPTLIQLDNTLRMFITFTGAYHGKPAAGI
jgi:hypothetical protein